MFTLNDIDEKHLNIIETIFGEFEGAILIDHNGYIKIFTDYYSRESGLSKDQVVGKKIDEVFPKTRMLEVLQTGKPIIADFWELNGKIQIVSRIPIIAEGRIIGAIGFSVFRYLDEARGFAKRIQKMFTELKYYKEQVRKLSGSKYSLGAIVGESDSIIEAKERVRMVAGTNIPVLLFGETGTGKELFAHAIHQESSRREEAFVRVNCAGIPENLMESELFGYEEGAFTGAKKGGKPGKFELADRGSIFLDEVSELSWSSQSKLLRALQEKEIERVGSTEHILIDTRVISATNISLNELVANGKFRKDLLFRLNAFTIYIPPLRERLEDIPYLCKQFIDTYNRETGSSITGITEEAQNRLKTYHWPGNVRELNIVIERACLDAREGLITIENLLRFAGEKSNKKYILSYQGFDIKKAAKEAEKATILRALEASKGNKHKAAELLGISRSALYYKLSQHE